MKCDGNTTHPNANKYTINVYVILIYETTQMMYVCRLIAITSEGNQYLKILSRLFSRFLLEYILDRMHSTDRIE